MTLMNKACAALMLAGLSASAAVPAWADAKDFEFQLVKAEVKKGNGAVVAVRLIDKRTGKEVPNAVIIAKRIDMSPDAMGEMQAPLELLPATTPGTYSFKTNLSMQGRWLLSLGAKVQGEAATIQGKLVVKALP
jgi:hypothetical protein